MSVDQQDKKQRKRHKNSRLGCPQCKERRIKCDETLPSCLKCLNKPMRCGYLEYPPNELEFIRQAHMEADNVPLHLRYIDPGTSKYYDVGQLPPPQYNQTHPAYVNPNFPPTNAQISGPDHSWGPMWPPLPSHSQPAPLHNFPPIHQHQLMNEAQPAPQFNYQQQYLLQQPTAPNVAPQHALKSTTVSTTVSTPGTDPSSETTTVTGGKFFSSSSNTTTTGSSAEKTVSTGTPESRQRTPGEIGRSFLQENIYNLNKASTSLPDPEDGAFMDSPDNMEWPSLLQFPQGRSSGPPHDPLRPSRIGDKTLIPLIAHPSTEPQFNPRKFKENFGETMSSVYGRVFVLREAHERFIRASGLDIGTFDLMMLFAYGIMLNSQPWLEQNFLRRRGEAMRMLRSEVINITDENVGMLLNMASCVTRTSVHLKDLSIKDHLILSWGPGVIIIKGLENPELFPKSMYMLRRYAEGLVYNSRCVYYPVYTSEIFVEFLDVIKEFGEKYIKNEDLTNTDDPLVKQYDDLVSFIEYLMEFTTKEKSDKHVLIYPVGGIYKILQRWFAIYPTMAYTVGSHLPGHEKVFYSIWHSLTTVLESVFAGGRYLFTYLFNGFLDLMRIDREALYHGLDENLKSYSNYFCRIMAFLTRRKEYISRNTVLNNPIPTFSTVEDRFKTRPIEIHECFITEFRTTVIKPFHYPSEATTAPSSNTQYENYYKGGASESADTAGIVDLLKGLEHEVTPKEEDELVDLLHNVNEKTCMLNNDYDPRYTDPLFEGMVTYQSCDVAFMEKYLEDRKLILQLDY